MSDMPLLSLLVLLPLMGAVILCGLPGERPGLARKLALLFSLIPLAIVGLLWFQFDGSNPELQFTERHSWIPSLGIEYFLGMDGLGLTMVSLSAILVPMAILASWEVTDRTPIFFTLILLLETGLLGVFTALNFFHWFLFWEMGLIPAFFLIKIWGGPGRGPAATQFFVYTMTGSIALLIAFLGIFLATGTMDIPRLAGLARSGELLSALSVKLGWYSLSEGQLATTLFFLAFLGFAVKVPVMPFHTWLPSTYAEAPTGVTMLLTGAMSKMGVYGFLRILIPIFPNQIREWGTVLLWLVVATIVFSSFAAFAQKDIKRILAYASINHLGYCLLGSIAAATATGTQGFWAGEKAAALNGTILQMFNHGITAAALFAMAGALERRAGDRTLESFGGLARVMPVFALLMGLATFSSLGLPGLNGFVGEFLIFKGAYSIVTWAAVLGSIGLLVSAIFHLRFFRSVFHGPLADKWKSAVDLTLSERLCVLPAIALIVILGWYPRLLVDATNLTVVQWIEQLNF